MKEKILFVFGMLFMLVMASGVAVAQDSSLRGFVNLEQDAEAPNVLEIGLLVSEELIVIGGGDAEDIYKAIETSCDGDVDCIVKEFENRNIDVSTSVQLSSVENAVFRVMYFNPISNDESIVPGCEELTATESRPLQYYDDTITYYYTTCTVDSAIYEGRKVTFSAILGPLPDTVPEGTQIVAPAQTVSIGEPESSPAGIFSTALNDFINAMMTAPGGIAYQCPPDEPDCTGIGTLPCIGVFLILGLLLASMYFSGKSPITLLDITTPRLPAPKGVAAGGQVLLPYGYGEMKRAVGKKTAAAVTALAASKKVLEGKMGYNSEYQKSKKDIADMLKSKAAQGAVLGGGKEAKEVMESLAMAGAKAGLSNKDMKHLLNKLPYHYGEAEHKTIADILSKLKAKGGREALMADTTKDYLLSMRTMQTLDRLSGHPAEGRSALHAKVQKVVGKYVGSNRYPIAAVTFAGSTDSFRRSFIVAKDGTKAMVQIAPEFGKGIARTTMETIGGKRAMERLHKKKPGVAAWLEKPSKTVELGQMFQVGDRMTHLGEVLMKEAEMSQIQFLAKQIYKQKGKVNFAAITEEEIAMMGTHDMDILKKVGYNKANVAEFEAELLGILGKLKDGKNTPAQVREEMLAFATRLGVKVDPTFHQFSSDLEAIKESGATGYNQFLQLQEMLIRHENAVPAAKAGEHLDSDKFYTLVGRNTPKGSDIFETLALRSLINDAEKGHLVNGGLKEELQMSWLRTVNRMVSLKPTSNIGELPEYMRNPAELAKIEKRIGSTLGEALTEEGKASLKKFTGKTVENATIEDYVKVLYGGKSVAPKDMSEIDKDGRVAIWGDAREMGALKGNFRVFADEVWLDKLDTRDNIAINMWTEARFKRSYIDPYDASVEANLDRRTGSAKWSIDERTQEAKKEWAKKLIVDDMEARFNSIFALNAYGRSKETAAFYAGVTAGYLEKALTEKGLPENHPDLAFVRSADASNPKQLNKLSQLLTKYGAEFQEIQSRKVSYDELYTSKQALVQSYEGGFFYAHKNMAVSSADRLYGVVTLRDQNGRKMEFAPEEVVIDFGGRDDLKMEFYKAKESKDPKNWNSFLESANKWANEGGYDYGKQKVFSALVWEYGSATHDYQKWYSKTSLEITSRKEAIQLAPDALRMFGSEGGRLREALKPWHDVTNELGNYIGKVALVAGGATYRASYDITPVSSYLRMHSWNLAKDVFTKDLQDLTQEERRAYEKVGIQHFEYHQNWQWTVDRNPWKMSSSHSLQQSTESFFNYGPRSVYASQDYLRGTMDKSQWATFKYGYGALADVASKLHRIPTNMFGGMQMSMQGYPPRMDQTGDPLKMHNYTPTRLGESIQALNPFSFDWGKGKLGQLTGKANVFEGSLQQRQLTGPDIMAGLTQAPQEIHYKMTGPAFTARFADANPGESTIDYKFKSKPDAAMADWFLRNRDSVYMYDKLVQDQGLSNTVRRTVSVESLGIRREQELRTFGVLQNQIYGFFSAPMFLWHMPLPGFPPSATPKEIFMKAAQRRKHGGGMRWGSWVSENVKGGADTALKVMQPWKGHLSAYCRTCGAAGMKGTMCRCGKIIYGT